MVGFRGRIFGLIAVLLMMATGLAGCGSQSYFESVEAAEGSGELKSEGDPDASQNDMSEASDVSEPASFFVQVSGEVLRPGVYEMPEGSRIYEAIEMAGGVTPEADIRTMNQAGLISDGQMIYVPSCYENVDEGGSTVSSGITADGKVNLNAATEEELMTLPGIGESKARLIVSYRETNGSFSDTSDIMKIQGIKQGIYDQIKDMVVAQ